MMFSRGKTHRAVVASLALLVIGPVILYTFAFSESAGWRGSAIPVVATAVLVALWLPATSLDELRPSPLGPAVLRFLLPLLVLVPAAAWVANQAIFEHTRMGWAIVLPAAVLFIGLGAFTARSFEPLPAGHEALGDVQATPVTSRAHLATSLVIAGLWIPLGLVTLLFANWCPNEGEGTKTFVLSVLFVVLQIVGNAIAGPVLDRRVAETGGVLLVIGRSLLVAVLLLLVGLALGSGLDAAIGPHGASRYCG